MNVDMLPNVSTYVNMFLVIDAKDTTTNQIDGLCCAPISASAFSESDADELALLLKALADPVRLRLMSIIMTAPNTEACTCDLPALVGRSQPTVSHHLGLLVKAGLLEREQRGKWAWFRPKVDRLTALAVALTPVDCC